MPRRKWLDDDEQVAWRSFLLATQLLDEALDRQLQRDAGMPHAYYGILVALSESPQQTVRMSDLARMLRYSQSRLTHAISSMERNGWVQRRNCPNDRRSQLVSLTETGRSTLAGTAPGHVAEVRRHVFDRLSSDEVTQLRSICAKVLEGLDPGDTIPHPAIPADAAGAATRRAAGKTAAAAPASGRASGS
jgi:DNA-binding MarR family transcriptional regulator